jgi:outer membrane protein
MKFLIVAAFSLATAMAHADTGDWYLRVGGHNVNPKSDNHSIVEVDSATMATFSVSYFFQPQLAVEVLAALPFKHDIDLVGGGRVAETKHLPPTVSVQYHFAPDGKFSPYVGAGLNATIFFSEDTTGALAGADLELETSYGPAAQLGVDIDVADNWFLNLEARYMDIDTKARLNRSSLGTVEIDPWVFGASVGFKF